MSSLGRIPDIIVDPNTGMMTAEARRWFQNIFMRVGGTSGGTYAPADSTYIIRTADTALSSAQVLGSLTTGYMKVTNTSGSVSSTAAVPTTDLSGTITNAQLAGSIASSKLVGTDIATVGTITSGTWNGTAINLGSYATGTLATTYGGTGLTTWSQGDLPYYTSSTALSQLAKSTSNTRYLSNQGTNNAPSWNQVSLTNGVVGTLPASSGGTGVTSLGNLTGTSDTNVTITIGGSPNGALITTSSVTAGWSGTLAVSRGGIGTGSAGIAAFNNITGYTAAGATGTTSTNLVFSTSPTLTTPLLGTPTSGTLTNCTGYTDANLSTSDITTNDVSSSKHGFAPKGDGSTTKFLNANGAYSTPASTGTVNSGTTPHLAYYASTGTAISELSPRSCSVTSVTDTTAAASANTKIRLDTESWDIGSNFDSSTNYRYTPTLAGIYQTSWAVYCNNCALLTSYGSYLFKNGAYFKIGNYLEVTKTGDLIITGACLVNMNGSTDYLELYMSNTHPTNSVNVVGLAGFTYLDIAWIGPLS